FFFFFSSRRRHTRYIGDWSSDVCSSDLGAAGRALTCSAIKPQGLPPEGLAEIAEQMALGGLDYIKDDHGLADQGAAPFAARVRACADAVCRAAARTGYPTRYVPSLSGSLDALRHQ